MGAGRQTGHGAYAKKMQKQEAEQRLATFL